MSEIETVDSTTQAISEERIQRCIRNVGGVNHEEAKQILERIDSVFSKIRLVREDDKSCPPESAKVPENLTSLQRLRPELSPKVANDQSIVGKYWEDNPTWSGVCGVIAKLDKPTLVITGTDDNFYQPLKR